MGTPKGKDEVEKTGGTIASAIAGELAASAGILALNSWLFMLLVGVIHAQWITTLPTIGYLDSVLAMALVTAIASFMTAKFRQGMQ